MSVDRLRRADGFRIDMPGKRNNDKDERVKLPLDPETALRARLAVDADDEPAGTGPHEDGGQDDSNEVSS
jgi:hypothetical protein